MVWKFFYDRDKAQLLAMHLLKSAKKVEDTHVSRKRLITQLRKLRSLKVDKKMAEHIDELERRINDLVTTEKRVIKNQQREDFFHRDIIDKINRLDKRLKDYLFHHKERELRFKALEQKVYDTLSKDQRLLGLQGKVKGLEILYKEVVASKKASPTQLSALKSRIDTLKERMVNLQVESKVQRDAEVVVVEHLPPRGLFEATRKRLKQLEEELGPAPPPDKPESIPQPSRDMPPPPGSPEANLPPPPMEEIPLPPPPIK